MNLLVKADSDFLYLAGECGLSVTEQTPNGTCFSVKEETQAHMLMRKMLDAGTPPVKFELREPTLNEILLRKWIGESED